MFYQSYINLQWKALAKFKRKGVGLANRTEITSCQLSQNQKVGSRENAGN
jgi:hypothetical protein